MLKRLINNTQQVPENEQPFEGIHKICLQMDVSRCIIKSASKKLLVSWRHISNFIRSGKCYGYFISNKLISYIIFEKYKENINIIYGFTRKMFRNNGYIKKLITNIYLIHNPKNIYYNKKVLF